MDNNSKYVEELVTTSNVFELVKASVEKVGLEYMAPVGPSRLDEIISKELLQVVRG